MKGSFFFGIITLICLNSNAQIANLGLLYADHFQTRRFECDSFFKPEKNVDSVWRKNSLMAIWTNSTGLDTLVIIQNEESNLHFDSIRCQYFAKAANNTRNLIVMSFKLMESDNLGEHGGYLIHKSVFEIWDLDKKIKLFTASPAYHIQSDYMHFPSDEDSTFVQEFTDCGYRYKITFNGKNILDLRDFEIQNVLNCGDYEPDHHDGLYKLVGDAFIDASK